MMCQTQMKILSLLLLIVCRAFAGDTDGSQISVAAGEKLLLRSPGFPRCIEKGFTYVVNCTEPTCYLTLIVLDIDLPEGSTFEVYEGNGTKTSPVATAIYIGETWTRPATTPTEEALTVVLKLPPNSSSAVCSHIGVKFEVEGHVSVKDLKPVITNGCQSVGGMWAGGRLQLTKYPATLVDEDGQYNCLWVIKAPSGGSTGQLAVYVRVTQLSLKGSVSVWAGNSTDAALLAEVGSEGGTNDVSLSQLNQPLGGFSSMGDMRVQVTKPLGKGIFEFVYGIFRKIGSPKEKFCEVQDDWAGFICPATEWCVPTMVCADGIKNCPRGEDEDENFCSLFTSQQPTSTSTSTSTSATTTGPKCLRTKQMCPDGTCIYKFQTCPDPGCSPRRPKKCNNGKCISRFGKCPGECESYEKKCKDGSCRFSSSKCPEEQCSYKGMVDCRGHGCYNSHQRCDGVRQCSDGTDEKGCASKSSSKGSWPWYMILFVAGGMALLILAAVCYYQRHHSSASTAGSSRPSRGQYTGTRMEPITAGARPIQSPRVTVPPSEPTTRLPTTIAGEPPPEPVSNSPPPYYEALQPIYEPPERQVSTDSKEGLPSYEAVIANSMNNSRVGEAASADGQTNVQQTNV